MKNTHKRLQKEDEAPPFLAINPRFIFPFLSLCLLFVFFLPKFRKSGRLACARGLARGSTKKTYERCFFRGGGRGGLCTLFVTPDILALDSPSSLQILWQSLSKGNCLSTFQSAAVLD